MTVNTSFERFFDTHFRLPAAAPNWHLTQNIFPRTPHSRMARWWWKVWKDARIGPDEECNAGTDSTQADYDGAMKLIHRSIKNPSYMRASKASTATRKSDAIADWT